jgi:hypothetical protein
MLLGTLPCMHSPPPHTACMHLYSQDKGLKCTVNLPDTVLFRYGQLSAWWATNKVSQPYRLCEFSVRSPHTLWRLQLHLDPVQDHSQLLSFFPHPPPTGRRAMCRGTPVRTPP